MRFEKQKFQKPCQGKAFTGQLLAEYSYQIFDFLIVGPTEILLKVFGESRNLGFFKEQI